MIGFAVTTPAARPLLGSRPQRAQEPEPVRIKFPLRPAASERMAPRLAGTGTLQLAPARNRPATRNNAALQWTQGPD